MSELNQIESNNRDKTSPYIKWLTILLISIILFILMTLISPWISFHYFSSNYIATFANKTGINRYLVKAIGSLLFIPWIIGIGLAVTFWNRKKRVYGISIIVLLVSIYNIGLYYGTRNNYKGKCYANTPNGLKIYGCNDQMTDPVFGMPLHPITPKNIVQVMSGTHGCNRVNPRNVNFFNKPTGKPQIWYYKNTDGSYDFFDSKCFHPKLGVPLKPVTHEVIKDWKNHNIEKKSSEINKPQKTKIEHPRNERNKVNTSTVTIDQNSTQLERFLNKSALNRIDKNNEITILIGNGGQSFNLNIYKSLKRHGINAKMNILESSFFSTKYYDDLKNGNLQVLKGLGLPHYRGKILFYRMSYDENKGTELYKTVANFFIKIIPFHGNQIFRDQFSARGAGFSKFKARSQAEERILHDFFNSNTFNRGR